MSVDVAARPEDLDVSAALHRLADHQAGYTELYDDMLEQFYLRRETLLEADANQALQVFCFYYALNRAGSNTAGYPVYAAVAVEGEDVPAPKAAWERFEALCASDGKKANESRNRGAIEGAVRLAQEGGNVFAWARNELDAGSVEDVYERVREIYGVGEKIARFFCRDAAWLAGAEADVALEEAPLLHPVDVWIRRASLTLWTDLTTETDDVVVSERLATACVDAGVSHAAANQGAWYASTQGTASSVREALLGDGGVSA